MEEGGWWRGWLGQLRVSADCPGAGGAGEPPATGDPPAGTKAAAAATSPGQRHPPGTKGELGAPPPPQRGKRDVPPAWKRFGEEQAPPHRRPRDRCGFCFQATLAFLKPDKQEEELSEAGSSGVCWLSPPREPERSRPVKAAATPRPPVPASQGLSDVNMAFVSQGAAAVFSDLLSPAAQISAQADARG